MRPYQFIPESTFTVLESVPDYRSEQLEETYHTHVITYDHAPSYRAFLLTEPAETIEPGQSSEFGSTHGSMNTTGERFITVGLE